MLYLREQSVQSYDEYTQRRIINAKSRLYDVVGRVLGIDVPWEEIESELPEPYSKKRGRAFVRIDGDAKLVLDNLGRLTAETTKYPFVEHVIMGMEGLGHFYRLVEQKR